MTYQDWRVTQWGLVLISEENSNTLQNSPNSATDTKTTHSITKPQEIVSWNTFYLLTGKHLNPKKRINKKVRLYRKGGNVFISDHEWVKDEIYKKNNVRAEVSYISAEGEAILNILDGGLKITTSTQPLEWRIA